MSPHDEIDELVPADAEPAERAVLLALAERLERERPLPSPAFRGALGRRLEARFTGPAPRRVRALVAAYGGSGVSLLAVAALGLAGIGPFAA